MRRVHRSILKIWRWFYLRNVKELVCLRDYFHLHIPLLFLRMHSQCLLTKTHFTYYCYEGIEVNLIVNCEKKFSAPYPMFDTEL